MTQPQWHQLSPDEGAGIGHHHLHRRPALAERQIELLEQELFLSQPHALEELESSEVITPAVKAVLYGELKQQRVSN